MDAGTTILDRYVLEALIGEGGLGVVWRARQLDTGRPVALKFIRAAEASAVFIQRFAREVKILGRLNHPNCIAMLDSGTTESGQPFLVMELIEGSALTAMMRARPPIDVVVAIGVQIADALGHAHERGVIHRDLKPDNVLLAAGDPMQVKVLDFGIGKIAGREQTDITKTGEVLGTPLYMSPEQVRGSRNVGPRTDLYALGVILAELIEGSPPFTGGSLLEIAMAQLMHEPPRISRPDCPPELADLVSSLLSKDEQGRPVNADDVGRRLRALGGPGRPALAPPRAERILSQPIDAPATRPPTTSPVRIAVVLAMLLAVVVLAVVARNYAGDTTSPTPQQLPVEATRPALNFWEDAPQNTDRITCGDGGDYRPGYAKHHTLVGLRRRDWLTYFPKGYQPNTRYPLVLVFAGDHEDYDTFLRTSGFAEAADEHGFIVVAPNDGTKGVWGEKREEIREVIDVIRGKYCVDRAKVFLVGHGQGGGFVDYLSCEDWVAAAVMSSFRPKDTDMDDFPSTGGTCARPGPILYLAPTKGEYEVPPPKDCARDAGLQIPLREMEQLLQTRSDCDGEPTVVKYGESECLSWHCDTPLMFCRLDGGYNWPGTPFRRYSGSYSLELTSLYENCRVPGAAFPAAQVAWEFFETSTAPKDEPEVRE